MLRWNQIIKSTSSNTEEWGYRTKRVGFIGDGGSKLLAPSPF